MANVQSIAQTEFWISPIIPVTQDDAGWQAVTGWIQIGKVTNTSGHGDTRTDITFSDISTSRVEHYKGTTDGGSETYTFGTDVTDLGQAELRLALASNDNYSIKEVWQDGTEEYFLANVNGTAGSGGDVNTIRGGTFELMINSAQHLITV